MTFLWLLFVSLLSIEAGLPPISKELIDIISKKIYLLVRLPLKYMSVISEKQST